ERFLTAIDRAREIGRAAFGATRRLAVVVEAWGSGRRRESCAAISPGSPGSALGRSTSHPPNARSPKPTMARTSASPSGAGAGAWRRPRSSACSTPSSGSRARARWRSSRAFGGFSFLLIHFARAVLANLYDDRGMDVVAAEPKEIASLGPRFRNWLLASAGA